MMGKTNYKILRISIVLEVLVCAIAGRGGERKKKKKKKGKGLKDCQATKMSI